MDLPYQAPSTLCIDLYRSAVGSDLDSVPPSTVPTLRIFHPTLGLSWKTDADKIRLTSGNDMAIEMDLRRDVYGQQNGFVALKDNNNGGKYVRHTGFVMYTHPLAANNFDFAWFLRYDSARDDYIIYNDYGGGFVVGYDQTKDEVRIVEPTSPMVVRWKINNLAGTKSRLKAVSMMRYAQSQSQGEDVFNNVNACVMPIEALSSVGINTSSCATSYGLFGLNKTKPGQVSGDQTIQINQVAKGTGVYPTSGCGFTTSDGSSFAQVVSATADQIELANNNILKSLQQDCTRQFETIQTLDKQIADTAAQKDQALRDFQTYLNSCKDNRITALDLQKNLAIKTKDCTDSKQTLIQSQTRPNYCLDVYSWSKNSGAETVTWDCHGGANQQWRLEPNGLVRNIYSDNCLNVWGAGTQPGSQVRMYQCTDWAANDKWYIDDKRRLRPQHAPNMCLETSASGENGNPRPLTIKPCNNSVNQKWNVQNLKQQLRTLPIPLVTFYEHCWYNTRNRPDAKISQRPVGEYDLPNIGIDNDRISSIRIPPGYEVTVYEHAGFGGESIVFVSDVECLVDYTMKRNISWNDQISSFKIRWIGVNSFRHPVFGSWKLDGDTIRLRRGVDMQLVRHGRRDAYKANQNFVALMAVNNGRYVRHTGFVMYTHPFVSNNFDWTWRLDNRGDGTVDIFNDYGGGCYVGYDSNSDVVLIVSRTDPRRVSWIMDSV